ncbi:hypothetical protein FQA39_LY07765 [Lamprigera yunnana]|nr:hypothetical protein FQA39_LY07765 [Lamprigera yunnana]
MSNEKSNIENIISQINATNTKRAALLLVVGFACFHGLLHLHYGSDSCIWLLSDGRYKANQEWQPYGCMLHRYSQIDTRRCLKYLAFYSKQSHFVFIGDSRIHQLYAAFMEHLQLSHETLLNLENLTHTDVKLRLKIEFIWSPYVSNKMVKTFRKWKNENNIPSVIVVGSGLWSIKNSNASLLSIQDYNFNLTKLVQPINQLRERHARILWLLQEPVNPSKLSNDYWMVTNEQIDLYNKVAIEVLSYSAAELWWSARLVAQEMVSQSYDGVHLTKRALQHDTQILLNMYCNDYMNFNDGSCCSSTESYTMLQIVTFSFLGMCILIATVMVCHRWILKFKGQPLHEYAVLAEYPAGSMYTFFTSLARMTVIMAYFFLCDRTNFFMKENKYYSEFSFWLPIGYVCALGLFFTEDSKFTKVLHANQIDEWKGWMQLVILAYHVTGASQILPINMHIKVLISAYLFLLGYQQFFNVWQRANTSMVNFFKMLFRLNFMTVTLCLCMNRPYQFYNFVPLMSFWFMMCYGILALPPHINAHNENNLQYFYLVVKFIGLFSIITILFMSEVFFEKIFVTRPWKALFVTTDDDIHEWWYRWKLDRYSAMYGMLFAVIHLLAQKYYIFDDNNHNNLFSRGIALSATLAGIVGIGCYVTFTFLCGNELDCIEIHSYIVFIPIVSYVILRNISGVLRTRYSSFFAWFGNISLELFISQYHIWLAADTHGVLVLIPGYPVLNLIVTSFIFVCASHEVHRLTKVLLPYAVPSDWRQLLRNVILFLAILVPIGINDGMF